MSAWWPNGTLFKHPRGEYCYQFSCSDYNVASSPMPLCDSVANKEKDVHVEQSSFLVGWFRLEIFEDQAIPASILKVLGIVWSILLIISVGLLSCDAMLAAIARCIWSCPPVLESLRTGMLKAPTVGDVKFCGGIIPGVLNCVVSVSSFISAVCCSSNLLFTWVLISLPMIHSLSLKSLWIIVFVLWYHQTMTWFDSLGNKLITIGNIKQLKVL